MSERQAEVYYLDDYREKPIDEHRRHQIRERLTDLAIEKALLESEMRRLEAVLEVQSD